MIRRTALPLALLAALLWLGGCETVPAPDDPVRFGPFYQPRNFSGAPALPADIRRVVILPVSADGVVPIETALTLDRVFTAALHQQERFEVVRLGREDCSRWFGAGALASTAPLPHGFLDHLAAHFAADAVLFIDLTAYRAYRPQAIGLRAKLATVRDIRLLWNFDEIISADDPTVANSARRRYLRTDRATQPLDLSASALQSPSRFATFAAEAMFATLPPR